MLYCLSFTRIWTTLFVEFREGSTRPESFSDVYPDFVLKFDLKETESLGNGVFISRYEMNSGLYEELMNDAPVEEE